LRRSPRRTRSITSARCWGTRQGTELASAGGSQYAAFVQIVDSLLAATPEKAAFDLPEVLTEAEDILRRERAAIAADPGVWNGLATSLGFGRFRHPTPAVTRG